MWEPKYVTLVSGESPCRGLDGLADGFMRWLGKERVRVHLLMGPSTEISEFEHFRPVYDWARRQEEVTWRPEESEVLIISTRKVTDIYDWVAGFPFNCPVVSLDARDKPCDEIEVLTTMSPVQMSLKTELPLTLDVNALTLPCPYGFVVEDAVEVKPYAERSLPVLFAAGETNISRRAFAEAAQSIPGSRVIFKERVERKQFLALLADAKVSIACYGAGFGSYRYLEIPAHGALLLAQPLPIFWPHNFRRDKEALFFTSPAEMVESVEWALAHPVEAEAIVRAGTLKVMTHHLTTHRAQWVAQMVYAKCQQWMANTTLSFPW